MYIYSAYNRLDYYIQVGNFNYCEWFRSVNSIFKSCSMVHKPASFYQIEKFQIILSEVNSIVQIYYSSMGSRKLKLKFKQRCQKLFLSSLSSLFCRSSVSSLMLFSPLRLNSGFGQGFNFSRRRFSTSNFTIF